MRSIQREIPQRELRNHVSRVLDEVTAGARLRVTVAGRAVADLVPIPEGKRFVRRGKLLRILAETPLDPAFREDIEPLLGATVEDL